MSVQNWFRPKQPPQFIPATQFAPGSGPEALAREVSAALAPLHDRAREFSSNRSFSESYRKLVAAAEEHAAKNRWSDAHQTMLQLTFLVNRAIQSKSSGPERAWIGVTAAAWLAVLWLIGSHLWGVETSFFGLLYWRYILMGALGGVTIVVFGLIMHTVVLDFDPRYFSWYLFKPVLGGLMGLVAVLIVMAGLVALEGEASAKSPALLYVLAFLSGFSERFSLRLLDKVVSTVLGGEPAPSSSLPLPPSSAAAGAGSSG